MTPSAAAGGAPASPIPAELRALKGWLLWKLVPKPGGKPLKLPYYTDGTVRRGGQGSDEDRQRWATWEEAQRVLDEDDLAGEWAGLGFALSADWGIVGLDFDACVDEQGRVLPEVEAVVDGTYAEYSPSGRGIHAFLVGQLPNKKSNGERWPWGFETFCSSGFLTMTGRPTPVCEVMGWDQLDHVNGAVTELCEARFGSGGIRVREPGDVSEVPPLGLTEAQIRSAMWRKHDDGVTLRVTPDGTYSDWMERGYAIHHETSGSPLGLAIWDEHSALGKDYPGPAETERKWASMGRRAPGAAVITFAHILRLAGPDVDVFDDVSELDDRPPGVAGEAPGEPPPGAREAAAARNPEQSTVAVVPAPPGGSGGVSIVKRRGIPEAHHLTTDQANANRLVNAFGRLVFVAAGRWHVWDGRRWLADEADVYRYGCQLSDIIRAEAVAVKARASVLDAAEQAKAAGIADSLMKWAVKSEMKGTIEAAIGLARKMLTVEAELLDRDPMALNVANGIVDLRTGKLRKHDPDELITKLVPVRYAEDAAPPLGWLQALQQIGMGNESWLAFMQRWAGYCLTGSVEEQCFVVHWGGGANGKSTVLEMLAETLGDYAGTAAPGLLAASKGDRHPTEIASLMGRRMVTAHESGEGVVLREDFIKQATGSDRMTARFMRADFFDFAPTHKLQLLTNHKPQIKGQDRGIWRRVLLVPYLATFGDAEAVRLGRASGLAEAGLIERLRGELEGILAWRVRGAVAWAAGGLNPPALVREASAAYKAEQDRVGQFVAECCERGAGFEEPLTDSMGGLYPAFVSWCKDGGIFPSSKARFTDDVLRVVGAGATVARLSSAENGKRRKLTLVPGLRLLPDE